MKILKSLLRPRICKIHNIRFEFNDYSGVSPYWSCPKCDEEEDEEWEEYYNEFIAPQYVEVEEDFEI